MATRLPLRIHRPLHRQCLFSPLNARPFSTTPAYLGALEGGRSKPVDPALARTATRHQKNKAQGLLQDEQLADERNVPDDIGLIPGTFIHDPFRLSKYARSFLGWRRLKDRLGYEWTAAKKRFTCLVGLRRFKGSLTEKRDMYMWGWGNRKQLRYEALQKYKHLHESFAKADIAAIGEFCTKGLTRRYYDRIETRPPGLQMRWKIVDRPRCKIVSNQATMLSLPGYAETGMHQVTFRIVSTQRIDYNKPEFVPKTRQVTEYLVMQRQFIRGRPKEWKIWGFTEASNKQNIKADEEYARKVNEYQTA